MHALRIGATLVLLVSLGGASIAQADDEDKATPKGSWYARFFFWQKKEPEAKKTEAKKVDLGPSLQERHARAKEDLLRRQLICLKLREIGDETGDLELQRQADQLDRRAFEIYLQKTGTPARLSEDSESLPQRINSTGRTVPQSDRPKSREEIP